MSSVEKLQFHVLGEYSLKQLSPTLRKGDKNGVSNLTWNLMSRESKHFSFPPNKRYFERCNQSEPKYLNVFISPLYFCVFFLL